jgi:DNA-binding protein H-NS
MSTLEELLKKQQEIEEAIRIERERSRNEVLEQVRKQIRAYGITLSEVRTVLVMRKPRAATEGDGEPRRRGRPRRNPAA